MPLVLEPCKSNGMVQGSAPFSIFLVEDSPAIRQRVVQMLRDQSIDVVGQAQSPQEAVDGILATRQDVVVLDIQLDGGTGLEVMRAVHFFDKSADIDPLAPVVKAVAQASAQPNASPSALPGVLPRVLPGAF